MIGNFTTTAIITKGLHCGPACKGLITTHFSLFCLDEPDVPEVIPPSGGGGPYPAGMHAHNQTNNVQTFYRPVNVEQQPYLIPRDQEAKYFRKHKNITLKINIKGFQMEQIYQVPENRANVMISVLNIINITKDKMMVMVKNIKRKSHAAMVIIKNIRINKNGK